MTRPPRKPPRPPRSTPSKDGAGRGADPPSTGTEQAATPAPSERGDAAQVLAADLKRLQALAGQVAMSSDGKGPSRQDSMFPYLLIRSYPGDNGQRPLVNPPHPQWESPDILVMPGSGAFDRSRCTLSPVPGQSYTVFVHVWNLGRSPVYGAKLHVSWVQPGFFSGASHSGYTPTYIGGCYVDLAERGRPGCHQLVAIPQPWTVVPDNDGHECLLATIDHPLDPWSGQLDTIHDRHVAQRNLYLASGQTDLSNLISTLGARVPAGVSLSLVHGTHLLHPLLVAHAPAIAAMHLALAAPTQPAAPIGLPEPVVPANLAATLTEQLRLPSLTAAALAAALPDATVVDGGRLLRFECGGGGYSLIVTP